MVLSNKLNYSVNLLEMFNKEIMENLKKNYINLKNDILSYAEILDIIPLVNVGYSIHMKELNFTKLSNEFQEQIKID
jgi:hypothetical protein